MLSWLRSLGEGGTVSEQAQAIEDGNENKYRH